MHLLNCAHKLATLEKLLVKHFPESLKVYGTVFHINRGNPFNLELLVDSWPDFRTVITRPPPQERTDDLDSYTNSYFMYSRDMEGLREILRTSDVVDWSQALQIQGLQNSLDEVIRSTADIKMSKVEAVKRLLYVKEESLKRCHHNGPPATSEKKAVSQPIIRFVKSGQQHEFRYSSLFSSHAELANNGWGFGGNEKSLRYIHRCIKLLPSACAMDGDGNPLSLLLMDQSAELRMGYTVPAYRQSGLFMNLLMAFMDSSARKDLPFYMHRAEDNLKVLTIQELTFGSWLGPPCSLLLGSGLDRQGSVKGEQHEFRFSSLSPSHAELLNKGWALGGNEKSLRYIERCIRLLPSGGFVNSSGNPVSVGLMDESAELRMAYTLPEYRGFGLYLNLVKAFMDSMPQQDLPLYIHMAADNKKAIGPSEKAGFRNARCGWYQWTCQPL